MDNESRQWVDSMPAAYERGLAPTVFRPFAVDLAKRAAARSPRRVLELAAGTGTLTAELLGVLPSAAVTATDLNLAMVELGRRLAPAATWRKADAIRLPFADASFDLVACQFGVMFFPDKRAAFAEARRLLQSDGALLLNAWDTLDTHDFEAAVVAGLRRAFPQDPPTFLQSTPHGYADVDVIVADMVAGGLQCETVESVTLEGYAGSASDVAIGYCRGTPLRAEIEARGDLATSTAIVADELTQRLGPAGVTGRMTAHVIEAIPVR